MSKDEEREKRLAEALRENLKRRKAQARDSAPQESSDRDEPKIETSPRT